MIFEVHKCIVVFQGHQLNLTKFPELGLKISTFSPLVQTGYMDLRERARVDDPAIVLVATSVTSLITTIVTVVTLVVIPVASIISSALVAEITVRRTSIIGTAIVVAIMIIACISLMRLIFLTRLIFVRLPVSVSSSAAVLLV